MLEGGGALGLAHIGVLKVFEEAGIPVDIVVGTSMGSIVGGLYASGYTGSEIETEVYAINWNELFSEKGPSQDESWLDRHERYRYALSFGFDRSGFSLFRGLLSGRKVLSLMDILLLNQSDVEDFDKLPRRYRAVAADIQTGLPVVISRGRLADAMRASMSIPGAFSPYVLEGRTLVDGGIVCNLPISVARSLGADVVIAVHLADKEPKDNWEKRTALELLSRTLDIFIAQGVNRELPLADYVLTVDIHGYTALDFSLDREIVARGEEAARSSYEELARLAQGLAREERPPREVLAPIEGVVVLGGAPAIAPGSGAALKAVLGALHRSHGLGSSSPRWIGLGSTAISGST